MLVSLVTFCIGPITCWLHLFGRIQLLLLAQNENPYPKTRTLHGKLWAKLFLFITFTGSLNFIWIRRSGPWDDSKGGRGRKPQLSTLLAIWRRYGCSSSKQSIFDSTALDETKVRSDLDGTVPASGHHYGTYLCECWESCFCFVSSWNHQHMVEWVWLKVKLIRNFSAIFNDALWEKRSHDLKCDKFIPFYQPTLEQNTFRRVATRSSMTWKGLPSLLKLVFKLCPPELKNLPLCVYASP